MIKDANVCINFEDANLSVRKTKALIKLVKKMGNLERAHIVYNYSEAVIADEDTIDYAVKDEIPIKETIQDIVKKFDIHSCKVNMHLYL